MSIISIGEMEWYDDGDRVVFVNTAISMNLKRSELSFTPNPDLKINNPNGYICTINDCDFKCGKAEHNLEGKIDENGDINVGNDLVITESNQTITMTGKKR